LGRKGGRGRNLEQQNKRRIRPKKRGDTWVNPCRVIWREITDSIFKFPPNSSLSIFLLL